MTPEKIDGATHALGAPRGWNEARDGECGVLHVRLVPDPDLGAPDWRSVWRPTPEELEALVCGARVVLSFVGMVHPPVMVGVEGVSL